MLTYHSIVDCIALVTHSQYVSENIAVLGSIVLSYCLFDLFDLSKIIQGFIWKIVEQVCYFTELKRSLLQRLDGHYFCTKL